MRCAEAGEVAAAGAAMEQVDRSFAELHDTLQELSIKRVA
jgi:hypothetical protein